MAEQVQASLDAMVAPLRDLMDRHIFTEGEIRAIVNRRKESEYLLRRRAARKADFLRYIEAEMLLEKLRALRTTQRKRDHRKAQREKGIRDNNDDDDDLDEEGNPKQKDEKEDPIGDAHIVQHIHLLFVRAIRKFRSDLSLHLQHADFCKSSKSWTLLGRVYAEALQIFPREAGIWIEAASNEFFGPNRSVKSARVLLQRAIRLNGKSSQELWIQYFTMELHYAQTLKGRKRILRPSEGGTDENDNDSHSEEEEEDNGDDDTNYNRIPMVILRNAIQSIPDNVQFRLKFLDACQQFPDTADLMDYVQESMAKDFANQPESWIARAMYQAEQRHKIPEPKAKRARTKEENDSDSDSDKPNDAVVGVLQDAIDTLKTTEMLLQAFRFAEDYRRELQDNEEANEDTMEEIEDLIQTIWSKKDDPTIQGDRSDLAMEETRYLWNQRKKKAALRTIQDHCTTSTLPSSSQTQSVVPANPWLLWASLLAPSLSKQTGVLKRALQRIPIDQHPDYVAILLQYFAAQLKAASASTKPKDKDEDDERTENREQRTLLETLQNLLLLSPKTTESLLVEEGSTGLDFELKDVFEGYTACLDHFYERKGIAGARSVYEAVLFRSNCCLGGTSENQRNLEGIQTFVDRCLELEHDQSIDTNQTAKTKRRVLCKLYDKAIAIFAGTSLEDSYKHDRNELAVFA